MREKRVSRVKPVSSGAHGVRTKSAGNEKKGFKSRFQVSEELYRHLTERKRAKSRMEAALETQRESEERYRSLFENSAVAVAIVDPDGYVLEANDADCRFLGYSHSELVGMHFTQFTHPQDIDLDKDLFQSLTSGQRRSYEIEKRYVRKDGEVVWGRLAISLICGSHGLPSYTSVVCYDITKRKQAEDALHESEARYRELFNRMSSGVAVYEAVDNGGDFIFRDFNPAAEKIEKISRKDILGKRVSEAFPGVKAFGVFEVFRRVWQTGKSEYFPEAIYKDERDPGSWRESWVFKLPSGEIVAIYNDITERKRAEEALRESELQYLTIGETIPYGVWLTDATGYCTYVSKSFLELVDMTMEQVQEFGWLHLLPPEDMEPTKEHWLHCVQTGEYFEREHRFKKSDGSYRNVLAIGRPIKDDTGKIAKWVGLNLDITERKQAEEEIQSLAKFPAENPNPILRIARDGTLLYVNEAGLSLLPDENLQVGQAAPPMLREAAFQAMDSGSTQMLDLECRQRVYSFFLVPVIGAGYANLYGRDVTERRQANEELKNREGMLQKIFDILPVGLWFADKDGKLLRGNPAGVKIWGAEPKVSLSESGVFKARRLPSGEEVAPDDWALAHTIRDKVTIVDELLEIDAFDGKKKTILNYTAPVLNAQGDVEGAIVLNQDITERKKSEDDLHESESRLRSLSAEITRVEESERQRLALFLHDEIGQSLALVQLKLGSLAADSKSKSDKRQIKGLRDLLETLIEQMHTLTFELSPPVLHQLGLGAAIEWAGEKINRDYGIDFLFNDDGVAKPLNSDYQAILFRCVRELMLNTAKHAKAKRLSVAIVREGETIVLNIVDDGVGFDPSLPDKRTEDTGFGLLSVREHLATMGGTCRIQSTPGQGTRITLAVPVGGGAGGARRGMPNDGRVPYPRE